MVKLFRNRIQVHCAFCRSPRRVYRKKRAQPVDYLLMALASGALMFLVFDRPDSRILLPFAIGVIAIEIGIQLRWRLSVICKHCGFDPVLYVKDHERAAQKVRMHLDRRRENPELLLASPLRLPTRRPAANDRPRRGQNLSKQV